MEQKKLAKDIQKFLDVYRFLSVEAKAMAEAQLAPKLKEVDEKSRKLYLALLSAAKDGAGIEEAIARMEKTTNQVGQRKSDLPK